MSTTSEDEAFRQWLLADPRRIEQWRQWLAVKISAEADGMDIGKRLVGARAWVWEIGEPNDDWGGSEEDGPYIVGAHPGLTVRCAEDLQGEAVWATDGAFSKPCGQRMGRFWSTPFGHYGEVRKAPGREVDRLALDLARRARAEGDERLARMAEHSVGKPIILPTLLEAFLPSGEIPLGCARRHGNMTHPAHALISECDSPRRKLHLHPARRRDALV